MIPREVVASSKALYCAGCGSSRFAHFVYPSLSPETVCSARCARKAEKNKRAASRKRPENSERVALIALTNTAATVAADLFGWARELAAFAGGRHPRGVHRIEEIGEAMASVARLLDRNTANAREEIQ